MLARSATLLALALLACGRFPMGAPTRDSAPADIARTPAAADAAADIVPAPEAPEAVPPDGREVADARDAHAADGPGSPGGADACVRLSCQDPTCFPAYCGLIGDGCGGVLDCGGCAPGWACERGQCLPLACLPITCDNGTPFPYCGAIGDGCGKSLRCACPNRDWVCDGHVCNQAPSGCAPIPGCVTSWGQEYCGAIGNGCGGVLDCPRECSRPGRICQAGVCVDASDAGLAPDTVPPPILPPPPPIPPPPPPPCPPPPPALGP